MFIVRQLIADLEEVLSTCDTSVIYRRLDSALDLLGPMLATDSSIGVMDVCTTGCEITLPNEVETPLAININGSPADFRNKWYEHHVNGPGSECCGVNCTFGWQNQGLYPIFREMTEPSQLIAWSDGTESAIQSLIIYGEDENNKPLYSEHGVTGQYEAGLLIPIMYGSMSLTPIANCPKIKRITQVVKPITNNFVRLIALDNGTPNGTLIGYYRPDEEVPAYRRIKISGHCVGATTSAANQNCCDTSVLKTSWVRMRYERRQMPITSLNDVLLVPSKEAIINAVEAIEQYRNNNKDEGDKYLNNAKSYLEEKQASLEGPNYFEAQYPKDGTYGGDDIPNMI